MMPLKTKTERFEFAETHMGSEFKIVLYTADESIARSASRAAFARIAALDATLSDYQPESELMRLCDRAGGPPVAVGADLFDVLERSRQLAPFVAEASDLTDAGLARLMAEAAALVAPSFTEGFGLPIVEGLAAGAPAMAVGHDIRGTGVAEEVNYLTSFSAPAWC